MRRYEITIADNPVPLFAMHTINGVKATLADAILAIEHPTNDVIIEAPTTDANGNAVIIALRFI